MMWRGSLLILFGALKDSCTWMSISFPRFGKFSAIISLNMFSMPSVYISVPLSIPQMWSHDLLIMSRDTGFCGCDFFSPYCCLNVIITLPCLQPLIFFLLPDQVYFVVVVVWQYWSLNSGL
jgi:hypothetical protein